MPAPPPYPTSLPRPVLKWAGGKWRLGPRVLAKLPAQIGTYFEPFVGSAAVFFRLAAEQRFKHAVLSDSNAELVNVYAAIRANVSKFKRVLSGKRFTTFGEEAYYSVRDLKAGDMFERAARTLYLNKTGYNGLYRVNSAGVFNVPFGRQPKPQIYNPTRLDAVAQALAPVTLKVADFAEATAEASKGDAVYFDPPYVPLSRTSNFTSYSKQKFDEAEHQRLSELFRDLERRKVSAVLSNSDTPLTQKLYERWEREHILVARPINSDATKRGGVGELLIQNRRKKP
jgi:DNA adenine methylase